MNALQQLELFADPTLLILQLQTQTFIVLLDREIELTVQLEHLRRSLELIRLLIVNLVQVATIALALQILLKSLLALLENTVILDQALAQELEIALLVIIALPAQIVLSPAQLVNTVLLPLLLFLLAIVMPGTTARMLLPQRHLQLHLKEPSVLLVIIVN